jgi:hypothetical protein
VISINTRTGEISGSSNARLSHVGKVLIYGRTTSTAMTPEGTRASGPFTIIARSGDRMTGTFALVGPLPSGGVHTSEMTMTITGGTGRYEGASGTLQASSTLRPFETAGPDSPYIVETVEAVNRGTVRY